jgi:CDP-paratose synthetase
MNILLIGTSSILAKKLISNLELKRDVNILLKKHTLEDIYDINSNYYQIDSINIDIVIYLSTLKKGLDREIYESNIVYPLSLISKLKQNPIIINIDTTAYEYRYNSYANSKKIFKNLLAINKFKSINLRIEHIYGYYPSENITSFLIREMLKNKNIDLSSGKQIRNFIYIDDVVSAIVKCIENIAQLSNNLTIDIASHDNLSIKELVYTIKKLTNSNSSFNFGKINVDENEFKIIDFNSTILNNLGWLQKVNLLDGLQNEIEKVKNEIFKK